MAVLNIEGQRVTVDDSFSKLSPEDQQKTVEEIAHSIGVKTAQSTEPTTQDILDDPTKGGAAYQDFLQGMHQDLQNAQNTNAGPMRTVDSFMRGAADTATLGTADEISGIADATQKSMDPSQQQGLVNKAQAVMNILNPAAAIGTQIGNYLFDDKSDAASNVRRERAIQAQRDAEDPIASTTGRITGALAGTGVLAAAKAPYLASLPARASLLAKATQGAKAGALYSGLYGLGSGQGATDRLEKGATDATTGALIGGAIPVVASTIGAVTKPVRDAVRGYLFPEGYADQKIAERLADAGMTADQAAAKMARNPGTSLADVSGKPAQNLLKTTTNIPGPAQARVAAQLAQKAMQQGDRLRSNIKTLFADPDGYLAAKDQIAADAQRLAAPLYQQAYQTPVHFSQTLEDILNTPAGKTALANAERIAANEQQPFQQFFVNMASPTTGTIRRVPDARGWDYIKRGFDDVIDANKAAGTFGKMNNEGRVISQLKDRMLQELDQANPAYAAARKVWSDQASLDRALQAGQDALSQSPEATQRVMASMSAAEKEAFRMGVANDLRDRIGKAGFTNNALLKFFSSRDQLANLKAAFDNDQQFVEFRKAMFAEARKRSTYNAVTGNSSTAKQLADMMDAGGLRDTANFVSDTVSHGPVTATLRFLGSRMKMLGGFTPDVANSIAKKLMMTNPQQAQAITAQIAKIEKAAISADQKKQLVYKLITPALSEPALAPNAQSAQ